MVARVAVFRASDSDTNQLDSMQNATAGCVVTESPLCGQCGVRTCENCLDDDKCTKSDCSGCSVYPADDPEGCRVCVELQPVSKYHCWKHHCKKTRCMWA